MTTAAPPARTAIRLAWATLMCIAVACALWRLWFLDVRMANAEASESARLGQLADLTARQIDSQLGATEQALAALAISELANKPAARASELARLNQALPFLRSIVVFDAAGQVLAASVPGVAAVAPSELEQLRGPGTRVARLTLLMPAAPTVGAPQIVATRVLASAVPADAALLAAQFDMAALRETLSLVLHANDMAALLQRAGQPWLRLPAGAPTEAATLVQRRVLLRAGAEGDAPLTLELSRSARAVTTPVWRTEVGLLGALALLAALAAVRLRQLQGGRESPHVAAAAMDSLVEQVSDALFVFSVHWKLVQANQAARTWYGLFDATPRLDFDADLALTLADGTPLAPAQWPWRTGVVQARPMAVHVRRQSTGHSVMVELRFVMLSDGVLAGHMLMRATDITAQHATRDLLSSEARFRTVIEDAPLAIAILRAGHFLYTNPRYRALHGYAPGDNLNGLPWRAMLAPASHLALAEQETLIVADAPREQRFEALGMGKGGHPVPVLKATAQVQLSDGVATLVFVQDISAQKQAEAEMLLARDAAQAASRSKADFLANMSHEIRSPLNAMIGLAYLLEQTHLPPEALNMVRRIRTSGRSLLSIINDILDVSKIEAGHMRIENTPFLLDDVLGRVADNMSSALGDKPLNLIIAPLPAGTQVQIGDALRLEQVLVNLTGNAIKFTDHGTVTLVCTREQDAQAASWLTFSVHDTGIGIASDVQALMFAPFTQADSSTTRRFGGTGLGLTICRQLVSLMGGTIGLVSTPGQGSTFRVSLPYHDGSAQLQTPPLPPPCTLLLAPMPPAARDHAAVLAGQLGWQVSVADSPGAVLASVQEAGSAATVVVLDWSWTDAQGWDTARAIRRAKGAPDCPLVLLAGTAELASLARHPDAELIDAVLPKPVTRTTLQRAVAEARGRRASAAAGGAGGADTSQCLQGLHLLVVDDSELNCEVLGLILAASGARTSVAHDGQAALSALAGAHTLPDLILMDVQMPGMDGLEATRQLRATPRLARLPIIALTAGAFAAQRDAALAAGMDYFVSKPFEAVPLIALIAQICHGTLAPQTSVLPAPPLVALDLAQGMAYWADAQRYHAYLRWFVSEYGSSAARMGDYLDSGDTDSARQLAHKLAGAAGTLGLCATTHAATMLEQALQDGGAAVAPLAQLAARLDEAMTAIAQTDPVRLVTP